MRSSMVYGECGGFDWHGWRQLDEEDAFYLDVSGPKASCGVGDEHGDTRLTSGFKVRMPLGVWEAILLEYVTKHAEGNAMSEAIETGWSAWEAETGRCYACCSYGPDAEERCKPTCGRCGGTGVARRSMKSLEAEVRALSERVKTDRNEAPDAARREAFLQGLRAAATIAAERGGDVLPASEIYDAIMSRVRFEEMLHHD